MKYRCMSGCVMVTGPPALIWRRKVGTTLPRLPSTLPKRTLTKLRPVDTAARCTNSSAIRFVAPMILDGLTALSLEISTNCGVS